MLIPKITFRVPAASVQHAGARRKIAQNLFWNESAALGDRVSVQGGTVVLEEIWDANAWVRPCRKEMHQQLLFTQMC